MTKTEYNCGENAAVILLGILIVSAFAWLIASIASCAASPDYETTESYEINELLMHEPCRYSVVSVNGDGKARVVTLHGGPDDFEIYFDVPEDQLQIATVKWLHNKEWGLHRIIKAEFHLHEKAEINGAAWNHGKFGQGQTIKVQ